MAKAATQPENVVRSAEMSANLTKEETIFALRRKCALFEASLKKAENEVMRLRTEAAGTDVAGEIPDVGSKEYFPFAAAWDTLAMSAQQHDRKAFSTASGFLDMRPVGVLRGLAYITENLARTPEDEIDHEQSKSAMSALAEVMSLVAVMVEHQNQSESQYLVELLAGKARAEQGGAS